MSNSEGSQKQQEALQRQPDYHQHAIHGINDMLEKLTDMIRTIVKNCQVTPSKEGCLETRVVNNDERVFVP